jgi:hypothetical protein
MNSNKFSTPDFLECIAKYFHGIFLTTMIDDAKARNALSKYINTHNELFDSFGSDRTSPKIYLLNNNGKKVFGKHSSVKASNINTIIDYALVNSALYQFGQIRSYNLKEDTAFDIQDKTFVLFSERFGLMSKKFDYLITTPKRKLTLANVPEDVIFVPKSFTYFRI